MTRSQEALEILQRLGLSENVEDVVGGGLSRNPLEDAMTTTDFQVISSLDSQEDAGAGFWESLLDAHINVSRVGRWVTCP